MHSVKPPALVTVLRAVDVLTISKIEINFLPSSPILGILMALRVTAAALLAAAFSAPLLAAPADDVRIRIAGFRELGAAFKAVNDALRSEQPQFMLMQISARQIRSAAATQYHWFPVGSGPQAGVKTAAKSEIWSSPTRFRAAQDAFAAQAAVFQLAVTARNLPAMRSEARKLGGTCKACHDSFREERE